MSLSINVPIFPGFKPGQNWSALPLPVRSPKWNFKETAKWNNSRQTAINGRVSVLKYWNNPLWDWEWVYGYIKDNPNDLNPFYPQPIPATDLGVLKGFYHATAGGANRFAYQPPDSVNGGTMNVASVESTLTNIFTIRGTNTARMGQLAFFSGLTVATFLNNQNLRILACDPTYITVFFTHALYARANDTGTAFCGQELTSDSNLNAEITHNVGAYPVLPLVGTPPQFVLASEPVQLIDLSTLSVLAAGAAPPSFTVSAADSVAPYQGIAIQFASAPTPPVTASFSYYYLCLFSEDTQDYENFQTMLWAASSVKFEQTRA